MPYTEMGNITHSKLALISERARQEPDFQFTSLAHLLNAGFLKECYQRLGRDRASGIDGETWREYGEKLEENLNDLVSCLKAKRYHPKPCKRVYIPKGNHERRPLGLPSIEDKIVQKGIAYLLEAIYEADFRDSSYGFRPKRNCHQALNAVDKIIMSKPVNHVIDADIKGFFDSVSHEWMLRFIRHRIRDKSLLLLIRRFLKAGYLEAGQLIKIDYGTPQGGNLSPILTNIFLHYALDLWLEKGVKPPIRGAVHMVRYADDFVCMVQYQEEAHLLEHALKERLSKFDLELHSEKTRVISFGKYERENANKQKRRPNTFDFLGFTHFCDVSRRGNFIVGRKTSRKKFRMKCLAMNDWLRKIRNLEKAKVWWVTLQAKLRGHYQYYGISGNMRSLHRYYWMTLHMTRKWLNRRSQRQKFSWLKFCSYLKHYPLPKPKIVHNFYTLSPVV